MNKDEEVKTLLIKYGAIELSRNYIRGIRSALANIKNGIETNNFALASRDVGLLESNLQHLELIFASEDGRKQLQHNLKK
jgi:hypothetical protein